MLVPIESWAIRNFDESSPLHRLLMVWSVALALRGYKE
jgi:hypothetical protein